MKKKVIAVIAFIFLSCNAVYAIDMKWQTQLMKALTDNDIPNITKLINTYTSEMPSRCKLSRMSCKFNTPLLCTCLSHAKTIEALQLLLNVEYCIDHTTIDDITVTNILKWSKIEPKLLNRLLQLDFVLAKDI